MSSAKEICLEAWPDVQLFSYPNFGDPRFYLRRRFNTQDKSLALVMSASSPEEAWLFAKPAALKVIQKRKKRKS